MAEEARDSVFTQRQRRRLREVIGAGRDRLYSEYHLLLPILEDTVRAYPTLQVNMFRQAAREHAAVAKEFERAIVQILETLKTIDEEGAWRTYVATSAALGMNRSLSELMALRTHWHALNRSRAALEDLLGETRFWVTAANSVARRRRGVGEQAAKRVRLAHWISIKMAEVGILPTAGVAGRFARTLRVVYEAAGEKVPRDMFRDVHQAIQRLRQSHPHLAPTTPRSLHKRNRQTSD